MDRLTKRHSDGSVGISQFRYYNYNDFQKLTKKLAEYEDLEEQGLLLKLPCKVNRTVYLVDPRFATSRRKVMECYIDEYTVGKYGCYAVLSGNEPFYMLKRFTAVNITDFGETVFLTREEAEKELERLDEQSK